MDKSGKVITQAKYAAITVLKNGLFIVKHNGTWGVIDKKGNIVLPIKYDYFSPFNDSQFYIEQNGSFTIIDIKGKVISTLKNSYEVAYNYADNLILVSNDSKSGIIDATEKVIVPIECSAYGITILNFIQATYKENKRTVFFDRSGRVYEEK